MGTAVPYKVRLTTASRFNFTQLLQVLRLMIGAICTAIEHCVQAPLKNGKLLFVLVVGLLIVFWGDTHVVGLRVLVAGIALFLFSANEHAAKGPVHSGQSGGLKAKGGQVVNKLTICSD